MSEYEVELGTVSEHRDVKTETPFAVDVEVHVLRRAPGTVDDAATGTFDVSFAVDDGEAAVRDVTADGPVNDLALVAVRAAADALDDSRADYAVDDPVAAAADSDYTVFDELP